MALVYDSEWANLLRESSLLDEFNKQAAQQEPDLSNTDLRMLDLRKVDLSRAKLRGAYLRNTDLRGQDLSGTDMHGASIHDAKIAGVLFPANLSAEEIRLSVEYGTRLRVSPDHSRTP